MALIQVILLGIWTLIQDKIEMKVLHLKNIGSHDYKSCSVGNENLFSLIFGNDLILVLLSIVMAYRGRNSKYKYFIFKIYI